MNGLTRGILILLILALLISSCKETQKNDEAPASLQNQTLETIFNRKSIREYLDKEISAKDIETLLKAGMAAPSSRDRRPWHC